MVIVLIGRLNTTARQAHFIFLLFKTLCKTPMRLMLITTNVTAFTNKGSKPVRYPKPKNSSIKAYKKP